MVLVGYELISVGRHSQQVVRKGLPSRLVFGFVINNTDEKINKGDILHNGLADKVSEMFRSVSLFFILMFLKQQVCQAGLIQQSGPIKVHVILILPSQSQYYTKLYVGTKKGQSSRAKSANGFILAKKEKRLTGLTFVSVYRDIVLGPESIVRLEPSSMSLHIFTESVGIKICFTEGPYYKSLTHYLKLYCVGFVIEGQRLDFLECQGEFVNISR